MFLICLDPATRTGWATSDGRYGVWDLRPAEAKKGKPERPAKIAKRDGRILRPAVPAVPATPAEPEDERYIRLWNRLLTVMVWQAGEERVVVHEGPLMHHASSRAAQLAFGYQTAISLWCRHMRIRRVEIGPYDLQRHALGKAARPGSNEMLEAAKATLGYPGEDPDEADAWIVLDWARKYVAREQAGGGKAGAA